jgi:predicted phosphoadenosine phosphosulfate sulfurtransferase
MQESYSVPEIIILEEAEKATLQLLPAKSREHYEKVFSEFNEWKEKRGVMTINGEVIDSRLYFSFSH